MPYILQTTGLSKKIGNKTLVTDVDLHIPKGEIYAFLGPNGAVKTTVMKMIMNLWKPTSGTIEVFGEMLTPKFYDFLKRIGSIIEFPTFYDHMTGRENLQLHCEYMGYYNVILSILVYTLFSRMFDLMQPPAVKHSIAVV